MNYSFIMVNMSEVQNENLYCTYQFPRDLHIDCELQRAHLHAFATSLTTVFTPD